MPDPVRLFISGYYGYANPGDEAILSVILAQLRARLPGVTFTVISGTPDETEKTHGVKAVLWSDPLAIAEAVRGSNLVITGGGGIFHDYGGFQENGLLTEGNWGLGFHVTAGLLAALFAKPSVIYAVGVGPIFSEAGRQYTRAVCAAALAITVRDEGSRRLLEEIGVAAGRAHVTADPAFLLESPASERAPQHRVGVVIRHWSHGVEPEEWERELAAGLDSYLEKHGGEVVFLPFQQFPGKEEDDAAVAERVYSKMAKRESAQVLGGVSTPAEKAAFLASCHLVVGMRLHSLIFSIKARVPFVALMYDEKIRQLVERTERGALGIAMADLRAELLAVKMEEAIATLPVDPCPLAALARENTDMVIDAIAHPSSAPPPMDLLRSAVMALLAAQKQLRAWLAEQKINYEYQVRIQQEELDHLRARVPQLEDGLANEQRAGTELDRKISGLEQMLAQSEAERQRWIAQAVELEHQKEALEGEHTVLEGKLSGLRVQHGALEALYGQTVAGWQGYADEVNRLLSVYRSQRAWRGMLALRKAYVLLTRQGWRGRLRIVPWLFSLLMGRGNLETEQLEFPARPKIPG